MQAKLDIILELTRDPEPFDELFVARVMVPVRTEADKRRRRRRAYTRPAVLGVAAVLVTAGAVAAVVRSVEHEHTPQVSLHSTNGNRVTNRPSSGSGSSVPTGMPTQAMSGDSARPTTFRKNNLEWGYTSDHSAYVLDTRTGLRLQTETYDNEFLTGRSQFVTLTLANLGNRPLGIVAPKGCALSVSAFHRDDGSGGDPSAFRDPTNTNDPQQSSSWCAAGGNHDPEKFVLQPGDVRTADIRISLGRAGGWAVLGECRCSYDRGGSSPADRPAPDKDAIDELGRVGLDVPAVGTPVTSDDGAGQGLFTPPIQVLARGA